MRKIPYHGGSLKAELQGALLQRKYFDTLFLKKGPTKVIIHNIRRAVSHFCNIKRFGLVGSKYICTENFKRAVKHANFDSIFLCFHGAPQTFSIFSQYGWSCFEFELESLSDEDSTRHFSIFVRRLRLRCDFRKSNKNKSFTLKKSL